MRKLLEESRGMESPLVSVYNFVSKRWARALLLFVMLFGLVTLSTVLLQAAGGPFKFNKTYVDTNYGGNGKPGWTKGGDMDGDGDVDIVAGGGTALFIYENNGNAGGWKRFGNLDGSSSIGANGGVLYDVDSDNDLDIVSTKVRGDLGWWENPGGPLANKAWQFHKAASQTMFLHDIIVVDLDKDGKAEEFVTVANSGYWTASIGMYWYRIGANPAQLWERHTIDVRGEDSAHGHSGVDAGDIDRDGHVDLGFSNGWYEAPDNLETGSWTWHKESSIYGISNTLVRDMNGDGDLDLVVSAGHHGQGVFWLENDGSPKSGSWPQHNISKVIGDETKRHFYEANDPVHLHHPECLDVADFDVDGDLDVVSCDLFFGEGPEPPWHQEVHNVYVYENLGNSLSWERHNIAPNSYPSHLLRLVDINKDGRLDIISESTGYSVVTYYENVMDVGPAPPTSTPAPGGDLSTIYVSSSSGGSVRGMRFADEDILAYNPETDSWAMFLDGSDVGLSGSGYRDIDAFHILDNGNVLFSIFGASTIPGVGKVDDSDIIRFKPSSIGSDTAGGFTMYFDGSDVGLSTAGEDVDAVAILAGGDLLLSTTGSGEVPGLRFKDEDLVRFSPSSLKENTSGTWSMYFDGSDVGLQTSSSEDISGVSLDGGSGPIFLTTKGKFAVNGAKGGIEDILQCDPITLGDVTDCSFQLMWDGSAVGFAGEATDAISVRGVEGGVSPPPASTPLPPTPTPVPGSSDWAHQDIGAVGIPGSATFDGDVISVVASGSDIYARADQFHYVYQPLSGDGEIVARVDSQTNSDVWAKAGVMIRESLADDAKNAAVLVTSGRGVYFQWRPTTGGLSSSVGGGGGTAPIWLRIVRTGERFDAYRSDDGANWGSPFSSQTVTMGEIVYIGLAVTSHATASTSQVEFSGIQVPNGNLAAKPDVSILQP